MKVWLHKSLTESKLFEKNSEAYKKAIKDGWKVNRKSTVKKRGGK